MALIHGSFSVWQVIGLAVFFFAFKCAAVNLDQLEKELGEAVLLSLQNARITIETAAYVSRMNLSHFHKCLRGENQFPLAKLARLPWAFWLWFSPALLYVIAKRNAHQIAEDFGLRKSA